MLASATDLADLLDRVAKGDRDAFQLVYHATSAKLYGVVLRILKRRELSDEILQEVYVKIWQRAQDFDRSRASPITWMATIARNRALDEVRKAQPAPSEDVREILEIPDTAALASDRMEQDESLRRLEACLEGLEEPKRSAVKLAYLEGCSRVELAERFGQQVGTIKTWLHRSLKQLKDCLGS